jgi:dTDP-4-dehydrorhamnose reductase
MPRILITGASGMLGEAAIDFFNKRGWEVHALARSTRVAHPEMCSSVHYGKIEDAEAIKSVVGVLPPLDLVLHGAALTNLETCESDFKAAINVNTVGTLNLISALNQAPDRAGKPLFVYISSDAVYPDVEGSKPETLPPAPASKYGITKLWGETVAMKEWERTLVLRTTIVGNAPKQFAGWILSTSRAGGQLKLFKDVHFSPLFTGDLCRLIERAWERRVTGQFNAGSSDSITKADFALRLLKRAGLTPACEMTSLKALNLPTPRSLNMSLDSNNLYRALETNPVSVGEAINHLEVRS